MRICFSALMSVIFLGGCGTSPTVVYSLRGYERTYDSDGVLHYQPHPTAEICQPAMVVFSHRPFVDSMSFVQENTETKLKYIQDSSQNSKEPEHLILIHWTYAFNPP
jgi:hypothetical protein